MKLIYSYFVFIIAFAVRFHIEVTLILMEKLNISWIQAWLTLLLARVTIDLDISLSEWVHNVIYNHTVDIYGSASLIRKDFNSLWPSDAI